MIKWELWYYDIDTEINTDFHILILVYLPSFDVHVGYRLINNTFVIAYKALLFAYILYIAYTFTHIFVSY